MPKETAIRIDVNGHTLLIRVDGKGRRWFECESWPDLAVEHDGTTDPVPCIDEFERRATAEKPDDTEAAP
jgi:hypothetical protein